MSHNAIAYAPVAARDHSVIEVTREVIGDVRARRATLRIRIADSRFFAGDAALEQAAEVRGLVEALLAEGLEADGDISLESVYVNVSRGLFSKSSTAIYVLRARCRDIEILPGLLDAISDRDKCTLLGLEWDWDEHDAREQSVRRCLQRATDEASAIAGSLGVVIDGVHKVLLTSIDDRPRAPESRCGSTLHHDAEMAAFAPTRRKRIAYELAGWEMAPSRRLGVRARVLFTIRAK